MTPCQNYGCNVEAEVMQQKKWGTKWTGSQDLDGMAERGTFAGMDGRWMNSWRR